MYESMSKQDLTLNFGDAGVCAAKFPGGWAESSRERQSYCEDVAKGTRFLLVFLAAAALSFAYQKDNLRMMSVLLSTCGIGFAFYLRQSAAYYAWLLKVAGPIDDFLSNLNRMDLCPAAIRWIETVRASGRDIYCFDLEIMAMMNEAYLLYRQGAGASPLTSTANR